MLFISYSRADRKLIRRLIKDLSDALTLNVWTDSQIRIGRSFTHSIRKALPEACLDYYREVWRELLLRETVANLIPIPFSAL
jgi:hypothetical protein